MSGSISKNVCKVLVYMYTNFGAFFIKCTIVLVCRCTNYMLHVYSGYQQCTLSSHLTTFMCVILAVPIKTFFYIA